MEAFRRSQFRMQLRKILWIIFFWLILSNLQIVYEYLLMSDIGYFPPKYNFRTYFLVNILITVTAATVAGLFLVFFLEDWFRNQPYWRAIVNVLTVYSIFSLIISFLGRMVLRSIQLELPLSAGAVRIEASQYLYSQEYLKNYLLWLTIVFGTIAAFLINDKYGPGILKEFLLGRYFQPKREERIFMFLDLRASTMIAEKLGEARYFDFVREVFRDATTPILYSRGEIYQYVGDEIIVSWKVEQQLEEADCLSCFFEVRKALEKKKAKYEEKYGVVPEFKAGLHYGYVMAGEVGVVKRDIVFSGDVLNTAARIQSKCNELGVDILFSEFLLQKLSLSANLPVPQRVGNLELRGKQEKMVLYTV